MTTVTVDALVKNLTEGAVAFKFIKSDGSIRSANGTTNLDLIPEAARPAAMSDNSGAVVAFYDIDAKGWRSFRRENLQTAA